VGFIAAHNVYLQYIQGLRFKLTLMSRYVIEGPRDEGSDESEASGTPDTEMASLQIDDNPMPVT